ncbi:MAG: bifunctional hydroxymethylpyrimidine kinase/phosphomethylpyrimidine kinase [Nannocystaceae bacterium]
MARASVWLLGGHDPSGGAGLARDVAAARSFAPELPLWAFVTAWTRQGGGRPAIGWGRGAWALEREVSRAGRPAAIKLGLAPASRVAGIAGLIPDGAPVVLDPVLGATAGGAMGATADGVIALTRQLAARGPVLLTPNRAEAARLLSQLRDTSGEPDALARRLEVDTLIKSVGAAAGEVCDVLCSKGQVHEFARPRQGGPDPRGTGCALATAIACGLARGRSVAAAVGEAIAWLDARRGLVVVDRRGAAHLS